MVGPMAVTDRVAATMLRLPIHGGMTERQVDRVVDAILDAVCGRAARAFR